MSEIIILLNLLRPRKSLCPTNYCIKHFSVSSSLMHPHLLESTLVQISVVDMLRSYHAALGVALYFPLSQPLYKNIKGPAKKSGGLYSNQSVHLCVTLFYVVR